MAVVALKLLVRNHGIRALSSVRPSPHQSGPVLTADLRHHLSCVLDEYRGLQNKASILAIDSGGKEHDHQLYQRMSSLDPVVNLIQKLEAKEQEMKELQELLEGPSEEGLQSLAREEEQSCHRDMQHIQESLLRALIPHDAADQNGAILEVRAGAGGKEAALFTADVFYMYQKFAAFKQWMFETLEMATNESGGLKHASASVIGSGVFGTMKHESGVHRVQRIPMTEGAGRIHTSTMSVAILPQPSEIDVMLNPNELRVETHRSSGPGGQSVNTTDSAVRLTHIPTGLVVHIQDDRSQHKNRSKALKILRARLYELKRQKAELATRKERKQQIGSGERHERIRTYHFLQDRMTDHRLGVSIHGIEEFMEGRESLASVIEQLQAAEEARAMSSLVADQ